MQPPACPLRTIPGKTNTIGDIAMTQVLAFAAIYLTLFVLVSEVHHQLRRPADSNEANNQSVAPPG